MATQNFYSMTTSSRSKRKVPLISSGRELTSSFYIRNGDLAHEAVKVEGFASGNNLYTHVRVIDPETGEVLFHTILESKREVE